MIILNLAKFARIITFGLVKVTPGYYATVATGEPEVTLRVSRHWIRIGKLCFPVVTTEFVFN